MPKSAIINLEREGSLQETSFKKLALFFDSLYVNERDFILAKFDIERSKSLDDDQKKGFLSEFDWLVERDIIKPYHISRDDFSSIQFEDNLVKDIQETNKKIEEKFIPAEINEEQSANDGFRFAGVVELNNDLIFKAEDMRMRIAAAVLNHQNPAIEFTPIVNSFSSYQQPKTSNIAVHFVLNELPIPHANTPWEKLLDFRNDEDVRRKYYALLNWINQTSQKDMPISHFIDQYDNLYSEFIRQYSLHKINSRFTTMELLVTAGIDFVASITQQKYVSAVKNLLAIKKQQVSLFKQEKEIEGRELAYVFSAKEEFQ